MASDYIDGEFLTPVRADGALEIRSPADLADLVGVHPFAHAHLERAIESARRAWPAFRRLARSERERLLRAYQARLREHAAALASTISREIGKPLWEAKTEVASMIAKIDLSLGEGAAHVRDHRIEDLPGEIRHRPLGVVAVVGPFNFPGHLPNGQIVPALLAGNCVIFKPSEKGATTALLMARCFHEAGFPAGSFSLLQGDATIARALVDHEGIDGILFTGSVAVGKAIARANVDRPGRLVALELGGKNPSIVLDDADLERTAREIAFSGFATSGQRCTCTSRVVVTKGIADRLIDRVAEAARKIVVGYPLDEGVFMGPVIGGPARDAILAAQAAARADGWRPLVEGGPVEIPRRDGFYLRPAVHLAPRPRTITPGYTDRELFGPDLAIQVVEDLDEAIAVADAGPYGLAAAIFTRDEQAFEEAADRLRVGVLHWNRSSAGASGRLPFGGIKDSGNHHPAGILAQASCTYPMALLLPAKTDGAPLPSWPGFGLETPGT
jgi:succinylglutamic semialdehyde dehydrogenase